MALNLVSSIKRKLQETFQQNQQRPVSKLSNAFNDNQGWFQQGKLNLRGGIQQTQQRAAQNPFSSFAGVTIPNFKNPQIKSLYSSVNTPEKQAFFNQQPTNTFAQKLNSFAMNRYVAPITQVPMRAKQLFGKQSTGGERLQGGLGVLGGTLAMIPDPIGDIGMPLYDYWKGQSAATKSGAGFLDAQKAGMRGLIGQENTGLGTAVAKGTMGENLLNLAELPIIIGATGKYNKTKQLKELTLKSESEIMSALNSVRNYKKFSPEAQMNIISDITKTARKIAPDIINNKEMKAIYLKSPETWMKYVTDRMVERLADVKNPKLGIGFSVKRTGDGSPPLKTGGVSTPQNELLNQKARSLFTEGNVPSKNTSKLIDLTKNDGQVKNNSQITLLRGENGQMKTNPSGGLWFTENLNEAQTYGKNIYITDVNLGKTKTFNDVEDAFYQLSGKSFTDEQISGGQRVLEPLLKKEATKKGLDSLVLRYGGTGDGAGQNPQVVIFNDSLVKTKSQISPEVKTGEIKQPTIKTALIDKKVDLGFEPNNIDIGKPAQQVEMPTTKVQTELPASSKVSRPQDILSLPEGEIKQQVVRTKAQLKKVLAENPNANVRIELKPGKGKIATLGQVPDRADVASTLPNRLNTFIDDVLGYSTKAPKGGTKKASLWTRTLRKGQEKITTKVEEAMGSDNSLIRTAASTLQNFFKGLGMSPERAKASMELRGEMGVANQRAYDVMDTLYKSLKNRKGSLERINAVLDPDISKIKVKFNDLTKAEKQVYGLIREGLDLVHDTSYANGHISVELYVKNKGKYVPRLYDVTELPPEVSKFITQGKKIANDLYKQRKDIDAWKMDNSLNDPVYALGKRLAQVETNSAIKKYTDFLASNQRFVSDVERPGFTKLSDSPSYGALSGKYVLNSAAEDLKGFFFSNQAMQNLYDVFRAYDRMPIRQLQKKLLTVFNPTTNVGNIVSDQVFGFVTGVDPFTLNKNLLDLKSKPKQFKQLNDYLMRQGITGTDITRTDFVNKLGSIDDLALGKKPGKIKTATAKVQSFYGGTDDAYKVSALKSLLDKGFNLEEATRKVADGFQNYSNVGKFFDLASKTPIIGKPFIKFQGDLVRIIKNGAVNNPLGLITFLGTLWGVARLSSKISGESDEDRITRENRFAAPMIPGLNIPLTWQTPIGEINVARYISPFYANNETTNIASNMIPFVPNIDTKKDVASNIAMNVNDPLVSPLVQLAVNRDFRGKPISDPDENKYQPSTLTSGEKLTNQASFLGRSYLPPPVNSAIDVTQAAQGKPNMYGTPQTLGQSVARLGGIKISQYGPEEVQKLRDKDTEYTQYKNESLDKQVNSVYKQQMLGKITPEQAEKRILNLQSQKENVSVGSGGGVYRYIDDSSGSEIMRTVNIDKFTSMPEQTAYQKALKEKQKYTLVDDILENLPEEQQIEALDALGITSEDATYYNVARQENYLKTLYVEDEIRTMIEGGQSKDQIMSTLVGMRKAVNEKVMLADGVINDLVDKNIISYADGKALKNIDKDLTPKKSGSKAKKPKKISVSSKKFAPKKSTFKPVKMTVKKGTQFKQPKYVRVNFTTPKKLL